MNGSKGDPFEYEDFTVQQLEALKGAKGDKGDQGIPGVNGNNGRDGQNGRDGVSPLVRINSTSLEWEISTDGGTTYTPTGISAQGLQGI